MTIEYEDFLRTSPDGQEYLDYWSLNENLSKINEAIDELTSTISALEARIEALESP